MTAPLPSDRAPSPTSHRSDGHDGHGGHGGHRWMMIACCIPMLLVVAALLLVSGVAGTGAIIFAGVCVLMMWLMMKAMP